MIRGFFLSECQAPLGIRTNSYEFARRSIIGMSIIIGKLSPFILRQAQHERRELCSIARSAFSGMVRGLPGLYAADWKGTRPTEIVRGLLGLYAADENRASRPRHVYPASVLHRRADRLHDFLYAQAVNEIGTHGLAAVEGF